MMLFADNEISGWWGLVGVIITVIVSPVIVLIIAWYQEKLRQLRVRFDKEMEAKDREIETKDEELVTQQVKHKKVLDVIRDKKIEVQEATSIDRQRTREELEALKAQVAELEMELKETKDEREG